MKAKGAFELCLAVSIAVICALGLYCLSLPQDHYLYDIGAALLVLLALYALRAALRLTTLGLCLVSMTLLAHCFGVFGLYNDSPFPVRYDHFVNFLGGTAAAWTCFDCLRPTHQTETRKRLVWTFLVVIAALGVCALTQEIEYFSAGLLGSGDGLFRFGGLGDTTFPELRMYTPEARGGAWENQAYDLHFGFLGTSSALIFRLLTSAIQRRFQR